MNFPDIKQRLYKLLNRHQPGKPGHRLTMRRDTGLSGAVPILIMGLLVIALLYFASVLGCTFFPALAQGCLEPSPLFKILYGLLYILVVLTLIIVPLIAIVFFRVTIVMPISKWIYGDENTLDARFFGWFDHCWSVCQKLVLK